VPLSDLLAPDEIECIATGFRFTEGPVWHPDGYLLFSDIPVSRIYRWTPTHGVTLLREPGDSNGLTFDRQGRLLVCEQLKRRVTRTEPDGQIVVLAERYQGKRLNKPNDIVVKSDGSIYFSDPPYALLPPAEQELSFQGVFRLSPDGTLTVVADDFIKPNGLAFSPDESILYVDDSDRDHVRAFDVRPDGTLANSRVLAETRLPGYGPKGVRKVNIGSVDGMKVDAEGNLYVTGPGGLWLFRPDGTPVGHLVLPEIPANCAWGDADYRTLYITARTSVYRLRGKIPGIPVLPR